LSRSNLNSGDTIHNYEKHFSEVFEKTKAEAALATGIFHREEIPIEAVKEHMRDEGIGTR
jgi:glutamine amidotransferase/cyclase